MKGMELLGWSFYMSEIKNIIEKIKMLASLKEEVSKYAKVKQSGSRYVALCPFPDHKEKTPSFTIDEKLGLFHCFGCHRGGDIFKFYEIMENYTFYETLEFLAKKYGIDLPKKKKTPEEFGKYDIEKVLRAVLELYKREFFKENSKGKEYFLSRNFTEKEAKEWEIGYAPEEYGFIKDKLGEKFSEEELYKAGVYAKGERGNYYERFRGRLIFPIYSINNKLLGFAGRILTKDLPKYINTQETVSFKKGRILFGLNKAKNAIVQKESVIIVEGYFDCLRLWQRGFLNAVATMGTALSSDHCLILKKYAKKIFLCFDGDSAGQSAALAAIKTLLPFGLDIQLIFLEEGEDPDTFALKGGKEAFEKKLLESINFFNFLFEREFYDNISKFSPYEKSEKVKKIMEYLDLVQDSLLRINFITELSDRTGVPLNVLTQKEIQINYSTKTEDKELPNGEKIFLAGIIKNEKVREKYLNEIESDMFQDPSLKKMVEFITKKKVDNFKNFIHSIIENFNEESDLISEILMLDENVEIDKIWIILKERFLKRKLKEVSQKLKNAKKEEMEPILREQMEILQKIKILKYKRS